MAGNGKRPLVQPGEPKQKTPGGLEIPVPEREDVMRLLRKAAKRAPEKPSRSGRAKR